MTKKVVIVREGSWGSITREEYDDWLSTFSGAVKNMEHKDYHTEKVEKIADVVIVDTLEQAIKLLSERRVDILFFISRGIIQRAKEVKQKYPDVPMYLLTGLLPEDELIFLKKTWLGHDLIRDILLD